MEDYLLNSYNTREKIPGLNRNWDFSPSRVSISRRWLETKLLLTRAHRRPQWTTLKPLTTRASWNVLFLYAPDGVLTLAHHFTLTRFKDCKGSLLVICATKEVSMVPKALFAYADAIFWKGIEGYDFSAYTLALREISQHSSGADVLIMNDSVYGPFTDPNTSLAQAHWDLTGFTASSNAGNHIQSYAFRLKSVSQIRMAKLAFVFFPVFALSDPYAVVIAQETRLARVASRSMSVGALWYSDQRDVIDPTLVRPFELIETGFPFLKRSLLGKHQDFQDVERIRSLLETLNHPIEP